MLDESVVKRLAFIKYRYKVAVEQGIYVADVGDGFCIAIGEIVIDCGGPKGLEGSKTAFNGLERIFNHFHSPDVFILSHFHIDHYNGLFYAFINHPKSPAFRIREVYYPRIPEFKEKEKFVCYLFAINLRAFGSETGVMEYDFLRAISKINRMPFKCKPLSKGDVININSSVFEILWPPAVMDDKGTLSVIKRALKDFEKAMEEDEETRELYNRVKEEGVFRDYFGEQSERSEFKGYNNRYMNTKYERRKLPEVVKKANESLRKAANHLSLALFEDDRFLFLGDTENHEIKQIVGYLKSKGRKNFYIFITPHHGTHWHNSLREIKSIYSITSNGSKLCSKMKPLFKETSKRSLATHVNGDIVMPIYPIGGFWRVLPWWL